MCDRLKLDDGRELCTLDELRALWPNLVAVADYFLDPTYDPLADPSMGVGCFCFIDLPASAKANGCEVVKDNWGYALKPKGEGT